MISNNVYEKENITYPYVYWKNAFNDSELLTIDNYCNNNLSKGTVIDEKNVEDTLKVRNSLVKFVEKNSDTSWIFDRFNEIISCLNDQYYSFNLRGYDSFQYTLYEGSEKGKYDWHMDTIFGLRPKEFTGKMTRKLSVVMLLNDPEKDFTGGKLQYHIGREQAPETMNIEKGMIVAFPSFLSHRVTPVHLGIRKSIVIWVEGPKFV